MATVYDVFLSHSSADKPAVEKLAVNRQLLEMVKEDGLAIADALREIWQALESEGFSAFNRSDPDDRHAAADRALEVSLARLSSEEQERFLQLAVFPDADVPLAVLERFWGSGRFEMQRFCRRLHDLSLLLRFNRQEGPSVSRGRSGVCLKTWENGLGPAFQINGTSPSASPAVWPRSTWLDPSPWPGPSRP
jgi:hypothetical protein